MTVREDRERRKETLQGLLQAYIDTYDDEKAFPPEHHAALYEEIRLARALLYDTHWRRRFGQCPCCGEAV